MLENRHLDKSVPLPLYYQLKTIISEEIAAGNYPPGSMIPTEAELSDMFQISRTTVRQAITELVHEERLYRIKSKGTFVARPKIRQEFMNRLRSFDEEILESGRTPGTRVLSLGVTETPGEILEQSRPWRGKSVRLERIRFADGDPVVLVCTYLPYDRCRYVLGHDFSKESLYKVLSADASTKVCRVSRICEAVAAEKEAEILGIKRGSPVHFITTLGYNAENELVEYSQARYRGDQNKFYVELTLG